jgi:hypothetical protein
MSWREFKDGCKENTLRWLVIYAMAGPYVGAIAVVWLGHGENPLAWTVLVASWVAVVTFLVVRDRRLTERWRRERPEVPAQPIPGPPRRLATAPQLAETQAELERIMADVARSRTETQAELDALSAAWDADLRRRELDRQARLRAR